MPKPAIMRATVLVGRTFLVMLGFTAIVLEAAACAGDSASGDTGGTRGARGGRGGRGYDPNAIVPVEVAIAQLGEIARAVTVSGVIEPIRSVGVTSQMPGALMTVLAEEGDRVELGSVLATLDDREIRAQLTSARASLELAQSAFTRMERLYQQQVVTPAEYERERANLAAASAQADQLEARFGYATVRAPTAGVVTAKLVEAGDIIGSQTRLFTIADISTLVVRLGVSELDVVDLNAGDPVDLVLDAVPNRPLAGRIRRVFPSGDPTTRLVPVEVAMGADAAGVARPGFLARARLALGARSNVVLIPASAIVGAAGAEAVFVVEEDHAYRRAVETGLDSEGRVEVVTGLQPGEVVITVGNNRLRDGGPVRIVTRPSTGEGLESGSGGDQ